MKLKQIFCLVLLGSAGYGAYSRWAAPAPRTPVTSALPAAAADTADAAKKATAAMAKFLETAPPAVANAISAPNAAADAAGARLAALLPYTRGAAKGADIARMLASDPGTSAAEEAKKSILEDPAGAVSDISAVLDELPETLDNERLRLLRFTGEIAARTADHASIEALLLKESQIRTEAADAATASAIAQVVALRQYYDLVPDPERRAQAYQAAMDSQTDSAVRTMLQRMEIQTPADAAAAALANARQAAGAPAAPADDAGSAPTERDPASQ